MKKSFLLVFLVAFLFPPEATFAVVPTDADVHSPAILTKAKTATTQLNRKDLEQQLGRKLQLRERALLWIAKKKIKKEKHTGGVQADARKIHPLAILACLGGMFSFLILPGILGFIFGIIAISRIKKRPEKWKGNGWAIAGILLSAVGVMGTFFVLTALFR